MTLFPGQQDVPICIQPCWIQEQQARTTMNEMIDLESTGECHLIWDGPHHCRNWLRSSPVFGSFHNIGLQEQGEDTANIASTSFPGQSDFTCQAKISSTSMHICDCSHSTLQEFLFSSVSSLDDLRIIDDIHIQGIHTAEQPRAAVNSSSPSVLSSSVITLLQNTRPKRLTIRDCNLQVSDLFAIMKVLRQKHFNTLEHLDLRFNGFAPRVLQWILSLHLGSLQSLKRIYLRQGIRCVVHQNVRNAIMEGLDKNRHHTLYHIDLFNWDRSIEHILDLNRAGRRVFQLESFPLALWPFLLERATKKDMLEEKETGCSSERQLISRQASVVYYMLRNGQILLQAKL
jgi:hypothetical protein